MALSMAIKCFGQRATFVDLAFPFNESSLLEWSERKYYYRNLDSVFVAGDVTSHLNENYFIENFVKKILKTLESSL